MSRIVAKQVMDNETLYRFHQCVENRSPQPGYVLRVKADRITGEPGKWNVELLSQPTTTHLRFLNVETGEVAESSPYDMVDVEWIAATFGLEITP